MAGFDLGGAFLGPIEQSQRIEQQKQLGPAQIEHLRALAGQERAETRKIEQSTTAEERLSQLMQAKGGPKAGESQSEFLTHLEGLAMEAGSPQAAAMLGMRASQAATAEARGQAAQVTAMRAQFAQDERDQQLFSSLMQNVHGPEDYARAVGLYRLQTKDHSQEAQRLSAMPYDPRAVQMLLDEGTRLIDKKRLAIQAAELTERQKMDKARIADMNRRTDAYVNNVNDMAEWRSTKAKEGGKDLKAPSTGESAAAMNLIENQMGDWFKDTPPTGQTTAAQTLAARAKGLMTGPNKIAGLTYDQALARSMVSMQKEGEFTKHGGFQPFGESADTAIELTAPPKDAKDLKEGKWYTYGGRTGQFVGGRFKLQDAKVVPPPPEEPADEEGDATE